MLTMPVWADDTPVAFTLTPADPMYYTERLSYVLHYNIWLLNQAGFLFKQPEITDFQGLEADLDTFVDGVRTWLENAVSAQESGGSAPLPPIMNMISADAGGSMILSILVRIAIRLILYWLERKFNGGTETGELAELFQKAFLPDGSTLFGVDSGEGVSSVFLDEQLSKGIAQVLSVGLIEESIGNGSEWKSVIKGIKDAFYAARTGQPDKNVAEILREALLFLNPTDEEFSAFHALFQRAMSVVIQKEDEISDVTLIPSLEEPQT